MTPIISKSDYFTLKNYVMNCPPNLKTVELGQLMEELERAEIVEDEQMDAEIIQINSKFEIEEIASKKKMQFTLTLPHHANLKEKKLSIFTPLGVALIGFKKGMEIQWKLPGGVKQIRINKVEKLTEVGFE